MEFALLCNVTILLLIVTGSFGNWLSLCVFARKRFRSSILTPFFVSLLIADCLYLIFRIIKLLYYQETLFDPIFLQSICSRSIFTEFYRYFSQFAPQIFVPFCHYEFYIRFSLLLMCFLATQRAYDIYTSSDRFLARKDAPKFFSYFLICMAFLISYTLELFGLSLFCSSELSSTTALQWYEYLRQNLSNETSYFIEFMREQSANQTEIDCVTGNSHVCSKDQLTKILQYYFDMHEYLIVHLIHKIQISTIGKKMARNELRLRYHYHSCPIRLQADLFSKLFNLLYSRFIGFNRYTFILFSGSIVPSLITIVSNGISLRWIIRVRGFINEQSNRRKDETRHIIIIITVECLMAIVSSWLVDVILSIAHCHRSLALADDCPHFLRQSQMVLVVSDLFNSVSNIFLFYYASRLFRRELYRMLHEWIAFFKKQSCCYCKFEFKRACIRIPSQLPNATLRTTSSLKVTRSGSSEPRKKSRYIQLQVMTHKTMVT